MTKRRAVIWVSRGLLLAALAGALVHLAVPFPASSVLQCVVLDVSGSLFWKGESEAGADVREIAALLSDDVSRGSSEDRYAVVAFAGTPALLCPPSPPSAFLHFLQTDLTAMLAHRPEEAVLRYGLHPEATRIEDALDLALALETEGLPLRILLLTDGAETGGRAIEAAGRLRRRGAPFAIVPLGPRDLADVRLVAARAPARVAPAVAFDLEVELIATLDTPVRVDVWRGGAVVAGREVPALRDVPARVLFNGLTTASEADVLEIRLAAPPQNDRCAENNRLSVSVVQAKPEAKRVLYIGPPGPRAVETRLSAPDSGYALTRDADAGAAQATDLIVIDDTPWAKVPAVLKPSLQHRVTHLGTGLLVLGGPHSLALGGYAAQDAVEPLLPVWASPDERLGLAIVLDCSGSMGESADGRRRKIDAAREALRRALALLHPEDRLALLVFPGADGRYAVKIAPQTPPSEAAFNTALRSVEPRGGTVFDPPLREAARRLADAGTGLRHILIVTDGETNEAPETLGAVGKALQDGHVTLTAIVTGRNPARDALTALGGRILTLEDWKDLEALIDEDVRRPKQLVAPGPIDAAPGAPSPLVAELPAPPPLNAANRTTLRADAAAIWQGPQGLPLLAVRRVGAGRTAVLATCLDEPSWGASWRDWQPHAATLIDRLAAYLAEGPGVTVELSAAATDEGLRLTAAWNEKAMPLPDSLPLSLIVQARQPDGGAAETKLSRVAAGRYEGTLPAPFPGRYALRVEAPPDGDRPGAVLGSLETTVPYAAEWRRLGRQEAFLKRLAEAGGGRVIESPAQFRADRPAGWRPRDGFLPLVVAALGLLLLELLLVTFWPEGRQAK